MATSRREFLKKGSLVALAAAVPSSLVREVSGKHLIAPLFAGVDLTKAAFSAQLNSQFRIHHNSERVPVKLVEVSDLVHRKGARPGKEGYSLLFRGSRAKALDQKTYRIEHDELGTFSFLIVPMPSSDMNAVTYEAVVNRLYS